MNTNGILPRIFSFALAAIITTAMLSGIDTLASQELAANSLMAQANAEAARPL